MKDNQRSVEQPTTPKRTVKVEKVNGLFALALGAMIATLMATLWVLAYLLGTSYGSYGIGTSLIEYVTGTAYGNAFADSSVLTVSFLRFVLAFGCGWPLATLAVVIQQIITSKLTK